MIGAFETPAAYRYIDTTPLEQMNMVGQAYKEMYENALKNYQTYTTTFGDFTSPISADVDNYNKETVGRLKEKIKGINDPDWLKTPEGQAMVNGMIADTDFAQLAKYRQSAENAKEWLKAYQTMKAQGKIKDSWIDNSPSNWDTKGKEAIFNETSPLEYMSAAQLTEPYTNDLRPSDLGSIIKNGGRYNVTGISKDMVYRAVASHFNDLIASPQGKKYYEEAKNEVLRSNPNLTGAALDNAAQRAFNLKMAAANADKIMHTSTIDPLYMQEVEFAHQKALLRAKEADKTIAPDGMTYTNQLQFTRDNDVSHQINDFTGYMQELSKSKFSNSPVQYGGIKAKNPGEYLWWYGNYAKAIKGYMLARQKNDAKNINFFKSQIDEYYPRISKMASAYKAQNAINRYKGIENPGIYSTAANDAIIAGYGQSAGSEYIGYLNKNVFSSAVGGDYLAPETLHDNLRGKRGSTIRRYGGVNLTNDINSGSLSNISGSKFVSNGKVVIRNSANGKREGYIQGTLTVPINSFKKYANSVGAWLTEGDRNYFKAHSIFGSSSDQKNGLIRNDDVAYRRLQRYLGVEAAYDENGKPVIEIPVYRKFYGDGESEANLNLDYEKHKTTGSNAGGLQNGIVDKSF